MARTATPWYWEERNGWYVTKDGQRHLLGDHPADAPAPRKAKGKWNAPEAVRTAFHTPDDWVKIRDSYKPGDPFREFLEFCWETGARPHEARIIEPRHVHLAEAVIAIPPAEAKGRKKWRLIRLEGRALEIVRDRLSRATVQLFSNRDGAAWTPFSINCRFCRLKKRLGTKFCNYQFRHGFCQRLLVSGADHLTVAALLGHSDGQMVQRVYSHMDQADQHLRDALKKGSGQAEVAKG